MITNSLHHNMSRQVIMIKLTLVLLFVDWTKALLGISTPSWTARTSAGSVWMALGDFTVELEKPLGIILEEREVGGGGVKIKELVQDGAAASSTGRTIVPGDVLLQVDDTDVSTLDFDSVMDLLISASPYVSLTLGDGLGQMDMPKNVAKSLKTPKEAFFVDAVVREAVREIRRNGRRLGDLLNVEVIIGAGVKEEGTRGLVRFFAIFSTDGVSTYSCNVSATGVQQNDGSIQIVSLSCAKDEGMGQTYDLIQETRA
jgi:hypothetical protein